MMKGYCNGGGPNYWWLFRDVASRPSSLLECHVDQQFFALDIDNVAEGALALAGEVESDTSSANPQIADVKMLKPFR